MIAFLIRNIHREDGGFCTFVIQTDAHGILIGLSWQRNNIPNFSLAISKLVN